MEILSAKYVSYVASFEVTSKNH